MFMHSAQRGLAMGMKYGLVKGFRAYHSEEATPEMDETAMQGAIGIIIAVGGVLIALYIIAVVVGSISYAVTSGNIKLSPTWNSTITKLGQVEKITGNTNRLKENELRENRAKRSESQTDGLSGVNIDSQAQATFNLANVLPIAIIGVGRLCSFEIRLKQHVFTNGAYNPIYPYDCDWSFRRPGYLNLDPNPNTCRTTKNAIAAG